MDINLRRIQKLRENLETVAFLISKSGAEREAHSKIVESLVLFSQLESELEEIFNNLARDSIEMSVPNVGPRQSKQSNLKNETDREVEKVIRRLPRWFRNPSQYNSTILYSFLKLAEKNQSVSLHALRSECKLLNDFDGNYNQMKNFGEKNHGKVFEEIDGNVKLWGPVKDYILKLYNENKVQQGIHDEPNDNPC